MGLDEGGGGGLTACTGWYKEVQAVRPGSVAGGGCYGVMEFGMSCRIKPKGNMCSFWEQFGRSAKRIKKELVNVLKFCRPKVAQIGPSWYRVVSLGCPSEPRKGHDLLVVA